MQIEQKNAFAMSGKERLDYYCDNFRREIIEENKRFHMHNRIFSREFLSFVPLIIKNNKYEPNDMYLEYPYK